MLRSPHGKRAFVVVPDIGDNRLAEHPTRVYCRRGTGKEVREMFGELERAGKMDSGHAILDAVLIRFVERVENYVDADGEAITTGAQFVELAAQDVIGFVGEALMGALGLSEKKAETLAAPQSSNARTILPSDGTVESADPRGSTPAGPAPWAPAPAPNGPAFGTSPVPDRGSISAPRDGS